MSGSHRYKWGGMALFIWARLCRAQRKSPAQRGRGAILSVFFWRVPRARVRTRRAAIIRVGGAILAMKSIAWVPFLGNGLPFEDHFLSGARTKKDAFCAQRNDDMNAMALPQHGVQFSERSCDFACFHMFLWKKGWCQDLSALRGGGRGKHRSKIEPT